MIFVHIYIPHMEINCAQMKTTAQIPTAKKSIIVNDRMFLGNYWFSKITRTRRNRFEPYLYIEIKCAEQQGSSNQSIGYTIQKYKINYILLEQIKLLLKRD